MIFSKVTLILTLEQKATLGASGIYDDLHGGGMILAQINPDDTVRVAYLPLEIAQRIVDFAAQNSILIEGENDNESAQNDTAEQDYIRVSRRS